MAQDSNPNPSTTRSAPTNTAASAPIPPTNTVTVSPEVWAQMQQLLSLLPNLASSSAPASSAVSTAAPTSLAAPAMPSLTSDSLAAPATAPSPANSAPPSPVLGRESDFKDEASNMDSDLPDETSLVARVGQAPNRINSPTDLNLVINVETYNYCTGC
ncbi:hypothetical protein PtB15_5B360 [Puccinia triticina]|nr:hypothetical protein PtB15_5B360 [Puccinia triticina]